MQARDNFQEAWERKEINEAVLAKWPAGTKNLPVEAFVYIYTAAKAVGLEGAKFMQKDYFEVTGRLLPIVRVTLMDRAEKVFAFHADEQSDVW
ncbi:hypothetical protein ACIOZM_19910 [Pseudomonas sp. NPDC087346]|uniref:hypothetical protein n=1 Tax=Pseudomonas sp. NPDC087346 TaxID=3364438 RepID=UPI0038106CB7